MNLWKGIPPGDTPPTFLNVVIQVVSGSRDKYEFRSEWEAFVLDRVIPSSVVFPVEYGFVPQTWAEDDDPPCGFSQAWANASFNFEEWLILG